MIFIYYPCPRAFVFSMSFGQGSQAKVMCDMFNSCADWHRLHPPSISGCPLGGHTALLRVMAALLS